MAFVYDELQFSLIIPKLIEGVISLATAIIVYRKSKYIVNRAFFVAFLAWSIVAFMDSFMYVIAAIDEQHLAFANIGRDIGLTLSNVTCFSLLFAVLVIARGKEEATSRKMIALLVTAFLIVVIGMNTFDKLAVVDLAGNEISPASLPPAQGTFRVTSPTNPIGAAFYVVSIVFFVISIGFLTKVLRKIKDPVEKHRIILFLVGLVLLLAGYVWFIIIVAAKFQNPIILYWIGYLIWTIAPIFTLRSVSSTENHLEEKKVK